MSIILNHCQGMDGSQSWKSIKHKIRGGIKTQEKEQGEEQSRGQGLTVKVTGCRQ